MRIRRVVVIGACCAAVAVQALFLHDPGKNWDRLAYYGIALKLAGRNDRQAQTEAYATAKASMAKGAYDRLAGNDLPPTAYRRIIATDPRAFAQQFPFYWQRIGYTYPLALLFLAGMPLPLAATLLSLLPALGLAIYGSMLLLSEPIAAQRLLWAGAFTLVLVLSRVAGLDGPDAAALFFAFLGTIQLQKQAMGWGAAAVAAAIVLRPDYALYAICLAAVLAWLKADGSKRLLLPIVLTIVAIGFYGLTSRLGPTYSFAIQARHSFIDRLPYPADYQAQWSASQHATVLVHQLPTIVATNVHILILCVAVFLARKRVAWNRATLAAAWCALAYLVVKILIYPAPEQRYYGIVGLLLICVLGGAFVAGELASGRELSDV